MERRELLLFVGGYTEPLLMGSGETVPGGARGITAYRWDEIKGELEELGVTEDIPNPSYLLASSDGSCLYCVNELKEYKGVEGSAVSAFRIDSATGRLQLLNRQVTCGADACHLCFSPSGRHLLAANYSGGSFCVFPIRRDGSLEAASCILRHRGKGCNPFRQEGPHPHQMLLSPKGDRVYVSDLGLDRLFCYRADWEKGWLIPESERDIQGVPGQGIRHGVFSLEGDRLYVMTELACQVNVYEYESGTGETRLIQQILAFPEGERIPEGCLGSAIRLHPNGNFLYCAVRGADHIAVFQREEDGRLKLLETQFSMGRTPRDFTISPDGRFLLAGNQDTDDIAVFSIDQTSGRLKPLYTREGAFSVTCLGWGKSKNN